MEPKHQTDHDAAGAEAKRLLAEDGTASATLKDMRTAKAARKEQLKAALTVVWSALESRCTVNGFATKETWAKEFAGTTIRNIQHIIFGRKANEANKCSRVVKHGDILVMDRKDGEGRKNYEVIDGGAHGVWLKLTEEQEKKDQEKRRELMEKPKKVKKITSKLTISMIIREVGSYGANVNSLEDNEEYSEKFEAAVKAHPEWFSPLVERLRKEIKDDHFLMKSSRTREKKKKKQQEMFQPAKALGAVVGGTVEVAPKAVEGAYGTKLRLEAANAAYGEKKVSKKVYLRILAGLEKYQEYVWTQHPPVPKRPENATVLCEGENDDGTPTTPGRGKGMIRWTSPEYATWEAALIAAQGTPEYLAWNKEWTVINELECALVKRYDPLKEGDLDSDDEGGDEEAL